MDKRVKLPRGFRWLKNGEKRNKHDWTFPIGWGFRWEPMSPKVIGLPMVDIKKYSHYPVIRHKPGHKHSPL